MLLAIIELLQSLIQCFLRWLNAPSRPRYGYKRQQLADRHDHHHSSKKPDWLKQEIIRLKAIMPQAGCRSIADICNRRFAASRKITVGKTYVHQILQQYHYEIQIQRRNLKHTKPKSVPRNLIWGIDLAGKTDTLGCLHFMFGIIDHGSRALLHLQALHDKTSHTLLACLSEIIHIHGKPKVIRTDNEAIFTSRIFRHGLKLLGIRRIQTRYDDLGNLITDPDKPEADRADTLYDSAANDHIISGGGNDRIDAHRGGDDIIEAGAGRDRVFGGTGKDVISGGDDRLYAGSEISVADAIVNGNSHTGLADRGDWLAGGDDDDILIGSDARDVLSGGAGADLLISGAGDDDIMGDTDWLARSFDWTVTDQPDKRYFYPVAGTQFPADGKADVIYAGSGSDHVWSGIGNDVIFAEGDDDSLSGEEGNDIILGGTGKDTLWGDGGNSPDTTAGHDYLDGGEQDDILLSRVNYLDGN